MTRGQGRGGAVHARLGRPRGARARGCCGPRTGSAGPRGGAGRAAGGARGVDARSRVPASPGPGRPRGLRARAPAAPGAGRDRKGRGGRSRFREGRGLLGAPRPSPSALGPVRRRPARPSLGLRRLRAAAGLGSWARPSRTRPLAPLGWAPALRPADRRARARVAQRPAMGWGAGGSCTPRPPIRQQPASERRVVPVVFLSLLLDLLAFTLLLPLLPGLLESHRRAHVSPPQPRPSGLGRAPQLTPLCPQDPLFGSWQRTVDRFAAAIGMPGERRYGGVLFGGLVGSLFSFLQFLCAPLTGAASDHLGRRPVMLLSLAGLAASYAVWATSKSFAAFLVSRVIGGVSKGNVSLCTAIVADLGSPPARSRGMAVIGAAFSLGFTLGPMLGTALPAETVPWLALGLALADLLFVLCFLPETLPSEKRAPSLTLGFRGAADLLSPLALLRFSAVARGRDPPSGAGLGHLRHLGLVYFLYLFLFSGLEFTLSFLVHQRFQFSSLQQGKMFFFIGLTMAAIQGTYARRISPGQETAAVRRAILLLVPAFLLIGWGRSLPALGLGLLLYSFAAAVVVPCLSSMVASYGSPGQKGTVMGTLRSLGALARAVGPVAAASAYWLAGAQACFTVCSGLFLLPFLLLWNLRPPERACKAE
ncbi:Major facilitator superfamily domain-containing protein 10 [Galemys pyrenaicus]|uniref:Major facilitator superfamily domain-containing protein 10 n=1 Tax=Galemys pyrenaicus TaxID=202257 RepID=A0A8J5ZQQ6_GALPY|nr:Major facilitator superfamily domain-containing protein 10 [Galemys pyrenaicus]